MLKYEQEIRQIIQESEILSQPMESVAAQDSLQFAGMDSISFVRLVVAVEEYFKIEFPLEYLLMTEADSIQKLCAVVELCHEKRED